VADLVGLTRLGVHDNFFEIGVDSIVGMRIVSRARQAGLALDPVNLFRYPNVAELAATAESSLDRPALPGSSTRAVAPFELVPEGIDLEVLRRVLADKGGLEDLYPLTPVQEGMLFHTLADPEAGHYLEQFVCRVRGELDLAVFKESWRRLVARHPALRTAIHGTDSGRPYQIVHGQADDSVDYHDWRGLTASEQKERARAYLDSDRRRGFVTSQPPLSRLAVFRLEQNVHQLVWSIHHVLIDGWCLAVLLHEILDIEAAVRQGQEPVLEPSRPFRDYVAWLRDQKDDWAEGYWRNALKGFEAATPLGVDGLSARGRGAPGGSVADREMLLPPEATAALGAFARSHGLTLSTVLQGAWALLLSRYSGEEEVLFGVTVAGRPPELVGVESMVGMFINVLPLRVAVNEQSRLIPWLGKVQAAMVELRRCEAIPPSRIRSWSDVPRGMPLFESIVIVQNLPFVASLQERASRLGIESARYLERTHYPLAVTVVPGTELGIKISFDTSRFDEGAIDRALLHLRTVLEAMAAEPERRLAELPSLMKSEQEQLLGMGKQSPNELPLDDLDLDQLKDEELDVLLDQLG
jgi:aryl carrier-like protein